MSEPRGQSRRRWGVPAFALGLCLLIALAFPDLALLFVVAVLIVYLIEPVVAALNRVSVRGRRIPRWAAVIAVYTCMLGATVGSGAIFGPVIASEAAALADEIPEFVHDARTRHLPRVNEAVQAFRSMLAPETVAEAPVDHARRRVGDAFEEAGLEALFASALDPEERQAYRAGGVAVATHAPEDDGAPVLVRLREDEGGTLALVAGDDALHVRPDGDGGWYVGAVGEGRDAATGDLDLTRAVNDSLSGALEASGEQVADVLHLGQRIITGLLSAIVGIFVTFMVAAFISIDVPRIVSFLTGLFPPENRPAVRRLLGRLNHGLSGVIRGQLAICVINAFLTGAGLLLFDVKFALLLALVAGVFSLIPIFGTILSTIPAVLLALPQGLGTAVLVIVWIIVIHFIEANILQPKIMGSTARIHPAAVILALLAGEHAYGIVGALVAVPLTSVVQSLLFFARDEAARGSDGVAPDEFETNPPPSDAAPRGRADEAHPADAQPADVDPDDIAEAPDET